MRLFALWARLRFAKQWLSFPDKSVLMKDPEMGAEFAAMSKGVFFDQMSMDLLWFLLFDEIHHRGQFSIYLRMADGKVPSIYGPSADEPWM